MAWSENETLERGRSRMDLPQEPQPPQGIPETHSSFSPRANIYKPKTQKALTVS